MKTTSKVTAALLTLSVFGTTAGDVQAATLSVDFNNITPTASVPSNSAQFPISDIADGITNEGNSAGLNGFVSASFGIITLTFDQDYHLNSFLLWNDVNLVGAASEGIDTFTLSFFDASGDPIITTAATTYTAPLEQLQAEEYVFATGIPNVRSVELQVLTSQWNGSTRIEIREVAFTAIPEPSSALLIALGMSCVAFRRR